MVNIPSIFVAKTISETNVSLPLRMSKDARMSWNSDYQKGIAAYAYQSGDYAIALRDWTPLAEQGNAAAQYNLGQMYGNGRGVPQDDKTAVKWYTLAAEQGHAYAQTQVEELQMKIADQNELRELQARAKQGDANAKYNLGMMYEERTGDHQNDTTTENW